MQAIGRRKTHANGSYDTPLNNGNKTFYEILKALPFKKFVKSNYFFNVNKSEFQQSIDL